MTVDYNRACCRLELISLYDVIFYKLPSNSYLKKFFLEEKTETVITVDVFWWLWRLKSYF